PIDHSRSKRFLFRRTTFALEIAAGEFSDGSRFLAVINCQWEEILTFLDCCGRNRAYKHGGVAARNDNCAIGEPGDFSGFDRYFIAADFGGDLLLHNIFLDSWFQAVPPTVGFKPVVPPGGTRN